MASKTGTFSGQSPIPGSRRLLRPRIRRIPEQEFGHARDAEKRFDPATNLALFPVVEFPREVFSAEARIQTESEILKTCCGPGPLAFLLKGSRLYSTTPLTGNCAVSAALNDDRNLARVPLAEWISDPERAPWAIELMNRLLRYHAWKRGMRYDELHGLFYFTRSKPKKLWWEFDGKAALREVTAPDMKWVPIEGNRCAEFQCGWKHEAVRAGFTEILGSLFLRLEPACFLTELDGKTPSASQPIGLTDTFLLNREADCQLLQTVRFWTTVLAKGHREIRIETGTNPIRVRLNTAPASREARLQTIHSTITV